MSKGITLPKELTGDRREMVFGLRSFHSNDADVRRRMLDAAMMIEHLDWSLRNVACLYREAIQLADAHRRRAEAAEARLTLPERASEFALAVLAERRRQVEVEGWTPEHDDAHDKGEMAKAAACYAIGDTEVRGTVRVPGPVGLVGTVSDLWPWSRSWWKPKDRRRDLVRATALLLAEGDRLDRAKAGGANG